MGFGCMKNNKRFAFTLSEVMVTLTLIGALGALTLSTVGSAIQQRARLAEFRTAYAKMESALQDIQTEKGRVYHCYDSMTNQEISEKFGLGATDIGLSSSANSECRQLTNDFVRAMGATRFCENTNPISGGCIPENYPKQTGSSFSSYGDSSAGYVLDNSMILLVDNKNDGLKLFAVDINGRKAPNKWGQDIFPFSVKLTGISRSYTEVVMPPVTPGGPNRRPGIRIIPVPTSVNILPGPCTNCNEGAGKDTATMMKESGNYNN